ncbi:unnamed protein product [Nezara viridula]|uniref:G-protein coupled receptors family 1 profile domain-containing protein n=1 Tax=Nezara viridula TaxID=85310 RepID=A0A9P0MYC9_NEZVI|nr:unnamed protein product [Nezara viridula]
MGRHSDIGAMAQRYILVAVGPDQEDDLEVEGDIGLVEGILLPATEGGESAICGSYRPVIEANPIRLGDHRIGSWRFEVLHLVQSFQTCKEDLSLIFHQVDTRIGVGVSYLQVSAYTLVAISVDRYMNILWPLKPRMSKSAAKFIMLFVWLVALLTALPIPIVSTLEQPSPWHKHCKR